MTTILIWAACRPAPTAPPVSPSDGSVSESHSGSSAEHTTRPSTVPNTFVFDGPVPKNLLVISLDTVRWDRVGRYIPDETVTPFLNEILAQGVVLDRHHSCSNWTAPSMMCATSGLNPVDLGSFEVPPVAAQLPTVARALGDKGYQTRLVTANPYYFGKQDALGFSVVVEDFDARADSVAADVLSEYSTLDVSAPWYLHGHFYDPHKPLCPLASYLDGLEKLPPLPEGLNICYDYRNALNTLWKYGDADDQATFKAHVEFLYAADMRYLDDQLRLLWSELDARGALDDTLVLIHSDHGEQILERRPVVDHPWDLFAEENRAIAVFWAKNLRTATVTTRTVHEDLAASLYALCDAFPDRSYRGIAVGAAPNDRALWLVHDQNDEHIAAVVRGDEQLTLNFDGQRFFHDLSADPKQLTNVYDATDDRVLALWDELNPLLDAVQLAFPTWEEPSRIP